MFSLFSSIMADDDSRDQQHKLGEFDEKDGYTYQHFGRDGMFRKVSRMGKAPFTLLFVAQIVFPVVIIILQVVTMVLTKQSTPAISCPTNVPSSNGQLVSSSSLMNVTCGNWPDQSNITDLLQEVYDVSQLSSQRLSNIIRTLSNLEDSSAGTKGAVDDILLVVEDLLKLQNKSSIISSHKPVSCQDIKKVEPDSPSGYYHINSQLVYCEMGELCSSGGAWTRLGYLDMSDSASNCPPGFRYYHNGDVRACGRPIGGASCVSVKFPSNGISYSEVCGRVIGYQRGSPDAADNVYINSTAHNNIDSYYIDGVSITHGFPRTHIWSMMAGYSDTIINLGSCPCNNGSNQQVQSFVGDDYFCESGNHDSGFKNSLYTADPLWDGLDCGSHEQTCCSTPGMPWFHKSFDPTTDYVELRVCGDEPVNWNEDTPVSLYEIYVK